MLWLLLTTLELEIFDLHRVTIENLGGGAKRPEQTQIRTSGQLEEVLKMTLLAWLAATFRLPRRGGLTISKVDFQQDDRNVHHEPATGGRFRLSLCSPEQEIGNSKHDATSGKCWFPLF